MRGPALAPELLRARRLVRAVVVCDVVFVVAGMGFLLLQSVPIEFLVFALLATVPLLVCDSGAWNLRPRDLWWRAGIGLADGLVAVAVHPVPSAPLAARERMFDRGNDLHLLLNRTDDLSLLFSGFALLCSLSVAVLLYALSTLRRHPVEHYHPAHRGGGGSVGRAAIDATRTPPTSGFPTGWVGRRRFF